MTRREVRISGFGGQGIILSGRIIGQAASLFDHKQVVMTESYGPEMMGGWSCADLVIADEEIDYPIVSAPQVLIVMSQDAFDRDSKHLKQGATVLFEKSLVHVESTFSFKAVPVSAVSTAEELGKKVVANIVMIGAFTAATQIVSVESMKHALLKNVPRGTEELNLKAFERGLNAAAIPILETRT